MIATGHRLRDPEDRLHRDRSHHSSLNNSFAVIVARTDVLGLRSSLAAAHALPWAWKLAGSAAMLAALYLLWRQPEPEIAS